MSKKVVLVMRMQNGEEPMMKCGHQASGVDAKTGMPVCVSCALIIPGWDEIQEVSPTEQQREMAALNARNRLCELVRMPEGSKRCRREVPPVLFRNWTVSIQETPVSWAGSGVFNPIGTIAVIEPDVVYYWKMTGITPAIAPVARRDRELAFKIIEAVANVLEITQSPYKTRKKFKDAVNNGADLRWLFITEGF